MRFNDEKIKSINEKERKARQDIKGIFHGQSIMWNKMLSVCLAVLLIANIVSVGSSKVIWAEAVSEETLAPAEVVEEASPNGEEATGTEGTEANETTGNDSDVTDSTTESDSTTETETNDSTEETSSESTENTSSTTTEATTTEDLSKKPLPTSEWSNFDRSRLTRTTVATETKEDRSHEAPVIKPIFFDVDSDYDGVSDYDEGGFRAFVKWEEFSAKAVPASFKAIYSYDDENKDEVEINIKPLKDYSAMSWGEPGTSISLLSRYKVYGDYKLDTPTLGYNYMKSKALMLSRQPSKDPKGEDIFEVKFSQPLKQSLHFHFFESIADFTFELLDEKGNVINSGPQIKLINVAVVDNRLVAKVAKVSPLSVRRLEHHNLNGGFSIEIPKGTVAFRYKATISKEEMKKNVDTYFIQISNSQEGFDTDGDGIADCYDTDSDNDTCLDVDEAPGQRLVAGKINVLQEPKDLKLKAGDEAVFTVKAEALKTSSFIKGVPYYKKPVAKDDLISYQWQISIDGKKWSDITAANTASLSVKNISLSHDKYMYRLKMTQTAQKRNPVYSRRATIEVNSAPKAVDDSYCFEAGSELVVPKDKGLLKNDFDRNADALYITKLSLEGKTYDLPDKKSVYISLDNKANLVVYADGSFKFKSNESLNEEIPPIKYTISDGMDTAEANLKLQLTKADKSAMFTDKTLSIMEGSADVSLQLESPQEVEGLSLKYQITALPLLGEVMLGGKTVSLGQNLSSLEFTELRYNAPAQYRANETVGGLAYTLSYGKIELSQILNIKLRAINDPPVANFDSMEAISGKSEFIPVLDNDVDPDSFIDPKSIEIIQDCSFGTLTKDSEGVLSYLSEPNFVGRDSFIYRVSDKEGLRSNQALVSILVKEEGIETEVKDSSGEPAVRPLPTRNN